MCDKGVIIKEICNTLDGIIPNEENAGLYELDSPAWWTDQVMSALCKWGLEKGKGFWVGAKGMKDDKGLAEFAREHGGKIGGEWLYDFTCLRYSSCGYLKRIPLVAECEWKIQESNQDEVNEDFEKLMLARADVRLMVFNGNPYRDERKSIPSKGLKVFRTYIKKCEHTSTGDTYLFAARLHDSESGKSVKHRFDYHLVVA